MGDKKDSAEIHALKALDAQQRELLNVLRESIAQKEAEYNTSDSKKLQTEIEENEKEIPRLRKQIEKDSKSLSEAIAVLNTEVVPVTSADGAPAIQEEVPPAPDFVPPPPNITAGGGLLAGLQGAQLRKVQPKKADPKTDLLAEIRNQQKKPLKHVAPSKGKPVGTPQDTLDIAGIIQKVATSKTDKAPSEPKVEDKAKTEEREIRNLKGKTEGQRKAIDNLKAKLQRLNTQLSTEYTAELTKKAEAQRELTDRLRGEEKEVAELLGDVELIAKQQKGEELPPLAPEPPVESSDEKPSGDDSDASKPSASQTGLLGDLLKRKGGGLRPIGLSATKPKLVGTPLQNASKTVAGAGTVSPGVSGVAASEEDVKAELEKSKQKSAATKIGDEGVIQILLVPVKGDFVHNAVIKKLGQDKFNEYRKKMDAEIRTIRAVKLAGFGSADAGLGAALFQSVQARRGFVEDEHLALKSEELKNPRIIQIATDFFRGLPQVDRDTVIRVYQDAILEKAKRQVAEAEARRKSDEKKREEEVRQRKLQEQDKQRKREAVLHSILGDVVPDIAKFAPPSGASVDKLKQEGLDFIKKAEELIRAQKAKVGALRSALPSAPRVKPTLSEEEWGIIANAAWQERADAMFVPFKNEGDAEGFRALLKRAGITTENLTISSEQGVAGGTLECSDLKQIRELLLMAKQTMANATPSGSMSTEKKEKAEVYDARKHQTLILGIETFFKNLNEDIAQADAGIKRVDSILKDGKTVNQLRIEDLEEIQRQLLAARVVLSNLISARALVDANRNIALKSLTAKDIGQAQIADFNVQSLVPLVTELSASARQSIGSMRRLLDERSAQIKELFNVADRTLTNIERMVQESREHIRDAEIMLDTRESAGAASEDVIEAINGIQSAKIALANLLSVQSIVKEEANKIFKNINNPDAMPEAKISIDNIQSILSLVNEQSREVHNALRKQPLLFKEPTDSERMIHKAKLRLAEVEDIISSLQKMIATTESGIQTNASQSSVDDATRQKIIMAQNEIASAKIVLENLGGLKKMIIENLEKIAKVGTDSSALQAIQIALANIESLTPMRDKEVAQIKLALSNANVMVFGKDAEPTDRMERARQAASASQDQSLSFMKSQARVDTADKDGTTPTPSVVPPRDSGAPSV